MTDLYITQPLKAEDFDAVALERLKRERMVLRRALMEIRSAVDSCVWPGGLCPDCIQIVRDIVSSALWDQEEP